VPPLSVRDLLEAYRRAGVYVQVSEYEGLPSALGEAMACGCVPVGTRTAGIPTLMGDTGFYVDVGDVDGTANAIRAAYASPRGNVGARSGPTRWPMTFAIAANNSRMDVPRPDPTLNTWSSEELSTAIAEDAASVA